MGFQDRDYYRDSGYQTGSYRQEHSALFYIIVINVVVWLLDSIFLNGLISDWCCLRVADFPHPTHWYRFLTYGFCHDLSSCWHVLGNMLGLFFLGQAVEALYGKREFLFFYLVSILLGGIYYAGSGYLSVDPQIRATLSSNMEIFTMPFGMLRTMYGDNVAINLVPCVGASGGVTAVVILFAINFPRQMLLIWGIIPMPAFAVGILIVVLDLMGTQNASSNIAHSVHLAGAAFAVLYYLTRFRFCSIFGHGRPRIKPYEPPRRREYDDDDYDYEDDSYGYASASPSDADLRRDEEFRKLEAEVEVLLKKISEQGMQSLTPQELARLREASQIYKTRR